MVSSSCYCCILDSRRRKNNHQITKEEPKPRTENPVRIHESDPDPNITWNDEERADSAAAAVCSSSAKDFYDSSSSSKQRKKLRSSSGNQGFVHKGMFRFNRQPFVPPLPRSKSFRWLDWEPSLSSVHELSQEI
ncbi:hypothetical protein LINPERHAP1_LOCUS35524 [Linum perenne]